MLHTAPGALGGHIHRRFHLPKGNEFEVSKIAIEDSDGGIRSENEDDYRARPLTGAQSEGSEGTSSVIHVQDLGLSAAPLSLTDLSGLESLEDAMEVTQLRGFLGLKTKPSTNVRESIREEVKLRLESASGNDTEKYLPIDEFNRIFGKESIKSLIREENLRRANANPAIAIASCISRRRILGILLYMKRLDYLENFVSEKITDDDLPLRPVGSSYEPGTRTRTSPKENTTLFKDWDDNDVVLFYSHQSLFFVPFFDIQDDKLCSYNLDQHIRLPWRKYELKSSGGNGMVHQVEIHPSHHNYKLVQTSNKPLYFALKEIDTHDEDTYHQELSALEKTCAQIQKERHLIKLLITFKHGRKYYFLFEWADGNLGEYWREHQDCPERTIEKTRWAASQCLGLATAVKRIHGLATWQKKRRDQPQMLGVPGGGDEKEWGRHGDIKPNNILCWWLLGLYGIEEFGNVRVKANKMLTIKEDNYFAVTQSGEGFEAIVKPGVIEWIKRLRGAATGDPFASGILRLIEEDMLVVDKGRRCPADVICTAIRDIIDRLPQTGNMNALRVMPEQERIRYTDAPTNNIDMKTTLLTADNLLHMHITGGNMASTATGYMRALTLTTNSSNGDALDQVSRRPGSINAKYLESHRASFQGSGLDTPETTEQPTQTTTGHLDDSNLYAPSSFTTCLPHGPAHGPHDDFGMPIKAKGLMTQDPNIPAGANTLATSYQQPVEKTKPKSEVTAPCPQESDNLETRLSFFKAAVKKKFHRKAEKSASSNIAGERRTRSWPFKRPAA
ncbi:hypothetical protein E0Z10_g980 [Xylaria hypoxylon]|uniref:Protein kinase domain-containing protein n=1 Tax=Xylaria hypoxylon TaxID=37992 RepID=A0A4Z0YTV1_9PEZI|nr:hypothetical protein E0Z10_g980 [Xylaria hypoxylon]